MVSRQKSRMAMGLRNAGCLWSQTVRSFFLDAERLVNGRQNGNYPVRVLATSKTGERLAYPLHRHWVETFGLKDVKLPKVRTDLTRTTLKKVGQYASEAFKKYGVGFKPCDLRHAWAVRAIHAGLSDSIAARMMGHPYFDLFPLDAGARPGAWLCCCCWLPWSSSWQFKNDQKRGLHAFLLHVFFF